MWITVASDGERVVFLLLLFQPAVFCGGLHPLVFVSAVAAIFLVALVVG
jgi:hypothetical protein